MSNQFSFSGGTQFKYEIYAMPVQKTYTGTHSNYLQLGCFLVSYVFFLGMKGPSKYIEVGTTDGKRRTYKCASLSK